MRVAETNFAPSSLKFALLQHLNFFWALNTRNHDHLLPKSAFRSAISCARASPGALHTPQEYENVIDFAGFKSVRAII